MSVSTFTFLCGLKISAKKTSPVDSLDDVSLASNLDGATLNITQYASAATTLELLL